MIRSYISAIKGFLRDDGYKWQEDTVILSTLNTLTKACKLQNDRFCCRMPIHWKLLELILYEVERIFSIQPHLEVLYKTMLAIGYYGLFGIGELTTGSNHMIKACNVHCATNKRKILIVLYTSKTHGKESKPQKVKITAHKTEVKPKRFFCPFKLMRQFIEERGNYKEDTEPFFIYKSGIGVALANTGSVLKQCIKNLNLRVDSFSFHSLRSGRAQDMVKMGYTIEEIKQVGQWRSNAVYKYLKDI